MNFAKNPTTLWGWMTEGAVALGTTALCGVAGYHFWVVAFMVLERFR